MDDAKLAALRSRAQRVTNKALSVQRRAQRTQSPARASREPAAAPEAQPAPAPAPAPAAPAPKPRPKPEPERKPQPEPSPFDADPPLRRRPFQQAPAPAPAPAPTQAQAQAQAQAQTQAAQHAPPASLAQAALLFALCAADDFVSELALVAMATEVLPPSTGQTRAARLGGRVRLLRGAWGVLGELDALLAGRIVRSARFVADDGAVVAAYAPAEPAHRLLACTPTAQLETIRAALLRPGESAPALSFDARLQRLVVAGREARLGPPPLACAHGAPVPVVRPRAALAQHGWGAPAVVRVAFAPALAPARAAGLRAALAAGSGRLHECAPGASALFPRAAGGGVRAEEERDAGAVAAEQQHQQQHGHEGGGGGADDDEATLVLDAAEQFEIGVTLRPARQTLLLAVRVQHEADAGAAAQATAAAAATAERLLLGAAAGAHAPLADRSALLLCAPDAAGGDVMERLLVGDVRRVALADGARLSVGDNGVVLAGHAGARFVRAALAVAGAVARLAFLRAEQTAQAAALVRSAPALDPPPPVAPSDNSVAAVLQQGDAVDDCARIFRHLQAAAAREAAVLAITGGSLVSSSWPSLLSPSLGLPQSLSLSRERVAAVGAVLGAMWVWSIL